MGHQHFGTLPKTKEWRHVVQLISGGADVTDVDAAASAAAERQMIDASNDPAVQHAFWLLTRIPTAARKENFRFELNRLGLSVSDQPTLLEIATQLSVSIDHFVAKKGGRTDLGEMAHLSAVESLTAIASRGMSDMFDASPDRTKAVLAGLGTVKQFAVLARDFFSRLARRQLSYFLTRELANHVGVNSRFRTIRDLREFEAAFDVHCRECSKIIKHFSGEWFSKQTYLGGIDQRKAGGFVHVAFKKIREELRLGRSAAHA